MINIGIIGLGTIFATQYQVLGALSDNYALRGVYDTDYEKALTLIGNAPIKVHDNLHSFLQDDTFQVAIIMTPPATHTDLAKQCLLAQKHVLLEKPATLSLADLEELYTLAKQNNLLFEVAYHASFAVDIAWYLQNSDQLKHRYNLGKLCKLECSFYDPYMKDGQIMPEKYALCGCCIDSAVNALSVCARLTALSHVELFSQDEKRGFPVSAFPNGITYLAETEYRGNDITMLMPDEQMTMDIHRLLLAGT